MKYNELERLLKKRNATTQDDNKTDTPCGSAQRQEKSSR